MERTRERKLLTDEIILQRIHEQIRKKPGCLEQITGVLSITAGFGAFSPVTDVAYIALPVLLILVPAWFVLRRKRIQQVDYVIRNITLDDFVMRQDLCTRKSLIFNENTVHEYEIHFQKYSSMGVSRREADKIQPGDPFYLFYLRKESRDKYDLWFITEPMWWSALEWDRPEQNQ